MSLQPYLSQVIFHVLSQASLNNGLGSSIGTEKLILFVKAHYSVGGFCVVCILDNLDSMPY